MATEEDGKAEQAGDSAALEALARFGLIAYGVVYLLIGWLALQLAWGASSKSADPSGALRTVADQPLGKFLLWLVAVAWWGLRSGRPVKPSGVIATVKLPSGSASRSAVGPRP